jgi:general nucleoside transport system permease protein
MNANPHSPGAVIQREVLRAAAAVLVALAVAFVVILLTSRSPIESISQLLAAPIQKLRTVGLWVDDVAKLTLAGLAFSLVFQARQFSMGLQGQTYIGALAATFVALSPLGASFIAIPAALIVGMAAGAIYGFIPGYAKARLGANEIVSSLMLNYIAINIANYIIRVVLSPTGKGMMMTDPFPAQSVLPALIPNTRVDLGLIFAVVAVMIVWFALYRTSWGLKLRLVGHNPRFAEYAGIRATFIMVSAMTASGALGGLLGVMFVEGQAFGKLTINFDGGLAFEGILIAIVARSRPFAVPVVAIFYGYLRQGAALMGIRTDVPTEINGVVQAIIILLVASSFTWPPRKFWLRVGRPVSVETPARPSAEAPQQ